MSTPQSDSAPPKIALLIDAENAKPDFAQMINICKEYGEIKISHIYAKRPMLQKPGWQREILKWRLTPVYAPNKAYITEQIC